MADNTKNPVWSSGLTYGAILGAVSVIVSVIFYVLGKSTSDLERYVGLAITILLLVYFLYMFRQESMGGYVKYGRLIGAGTVISLVAGVIGAIYFVILLNWIDPSLQNLIDEKASEKMLEQLAKRDMYPSQAEIDEMMEKTKFFRGPVFLAIGTVLNMVILGVVVSLIAGIFLKKDPKDPFAGV